MKVERHEPRNNMIMSAVRPAAIAPSLSNPMIESLTKTD